MNEHNADTAENVTIEDLQAQIEDLAAQNFDLVNLLERQDYQLEATQVILQMLCLLLSESSTVQAKRLQDSVSLNFLAMCADNPDMQVEFQQVFDKFFQNHQ
ncbi:hypothetical protein SAMN05660772_02075 [Pasteurella testudinis DSM 23072]|uniref:Uncharacterized protein n=1 Tax=Pasteurella testudinis DSM 23072 TaxID=1122938 RepID=A0A1W1UMN3_9PAST|nr:hypothetical protein [Pasteurella testudinis]SMB82356.1 hypothetical protein SAMN05660772_02075 [Pasteurella testudinis DSM 23072]SUB52239.1 Uncharacterised protein [Pasteurella testudinis]